MTEDQVEKLSRLIGGAFDFSALDTFMTKAFGYNAIDDVAGENVGMNQVARRCLDLAQQLGLTVNLLSHILVSPLATAELRALAVLIFPDLEVLGQPIEEVITSAATALAALAGAPREIVLALDVAVAKLGAYKALHEALHQAQNSIKPEPPDDQDPARIAAFRSAARAYVLALRTAETSARDALDEFPAGSRPTDQDWIDVLGQCWRKLKAAVDAGDFDDADLALSVTARTLDPLLGQINRRIVKVVSDMPLEQIIDTLAADPQPTPASLGSLKAIKASLLGHVYEHNLWQNADDTFALLDRTLKESGNATFIRFSRRWRIAERLIRALVAGKDGQDWAMALNAGMHMINDALERLVATTESQANGFAALMADPYEALRNEARGRFFDVDKDFKKICRDLGRIRAPLQALAGANP